MPKSPPTVLDGQRAIAALLKKHWPLDQAIAVADRWARESDPRFAGVAELLRAELAR